MGEPVLLVCIWLSSPRYKQMNITWSRSSDSSCTICLSITSGAAWPRVFLHCPVFPASPCVTYSSAHSQQNGSLLLFEARGTEPSSTFWVRTLSYWLKVDSFGSDSLTNLVIHFDGNWKISSQQIPLPVKIYNGTTTISIVFNERQ